MDIVDSGEYFLCFRIDKLKIAFSTQRVIRVIRAVEITPLPGAPAVIAGMINLKGNIIPIVNVRKKFKLSSISLSPEHALIIVQSRQLQVGFIAEEVLGLDIVEEADINNSPQLFPDASLDVKGVTVIRDEIILIYDVHGFLSLKDEESLVKAIQKQKKKA